MTGIFIGLGSNLTVEGIGGPDRVLEAAAQALGEGMTVAARSRTYRSAPVPASAQPWFCNAVLELGTACPPDRLLARLHDIERRFARERRERWAARTLDLDLLDYRGLVRADAPTLPHPRLGGRAFVLLPLAELAPRWRHPVNGAGLAELIARLPPEQRAEPL